MELLKKKILVVEDDPTMIDLLEACFARKGYQVVVSKDAESALKDINQTDIDLFLVDLILPGIHGFEFVRRLRKMPMYFRTPILIISGKMGDNEKEVAIAAGADDMLPKPFSTQELYQKIESLLGE